jgi:hypothetical protein
MEVHLIQRFEDHMERDEVLFSEIRNDIKAIKENHLSHMQVSLASLETNIKWVSAGVITIIGGIIAVFFRS